MRGLASIFRSSPAATGLPPPRRRAPASLALLACAAAVALVACGGGGGADSPAARRTNFDVAPDVPPGSPAATHWEWFVKNVRTWSPKFQLQLVPGSPDVASLGRDRVQVMRADLDDVAHLVPELAVLALPLLFESDAEADYVLDQHVFPEVRRRLDAHGLALLAWTEGEPRVLYAAGAPDAAATPQLATLDAHAAGPGAPAGTTATLLDGGATPTLVLAASSWFDALPPRDEDSLRMAYATREARADTRRVASETLDALAQKPTHAVRTLTDAERREWRAQLEPYRRARIAALGAAAESLHAVVERGRAEFAKQAAGTPAAP